jgi:hypothetical protein
MSSFRLVEVSFDPIDFDPTLEDEFTLTAVSKEIENAKDIEQLRQGAMNLLKICIHRQVVIRGLAKRLAVKAEQCLTREEAQKLIIKADKAHSKLSTVSS